MTSFQYSLNVPSAQSNGMLKFRNLNSQMENLMHAMTGLIIHHTCTITNDGST